MQILCPGWDKRKLFHCLSTDEMSLKKKKKKKEKDFSVLILPSQRAEWERGKK